MSFYNVTKSGCVLAAFLLLQAPSFGASKQCAPPQPAMSSACPCSQDMQASMTWNFPKEGSQLLQDIRRDARQIRREAATVESHHPYAESDWMFHADELNTIRWEVNNMGRKLCRLQTIHDQLMPWQQKAVESTAPLVKELAIFTDDAIEFANGHEENLWNPLYGTYIRNIYTEASHVPMAASREG